jgi:hypothetical protein
MGIPPSTYLRRRPQTTPAEPHDLSRGELLTASGQWVEAY